MKGRSFQEWVHWLEVGTGASLIRRLSVALGVVVLTLLVGYKQFQGPASETTLAQAVVGRQLSQGLGYTTPVNYPQTAAALFEHGSSWTAQPFPELYAAPLYPAAIGVTFAAMPRWFADALFMMEPEPPAGFAPDYVLLALNCLFFWVAAFQTYVLARSIFDPRTGALALAAVVLSAPLWAEVVAVNGTALNMCVLLGFLQCCQAVERGSVKGTLPFAALASAGALAGALFLADYHAGVVVIPLLVFVWFVFAGQRLPALLPVLAGFLLVAGGWATFNTLSSGSPVGLAWQQVAMNTDRSPADPQVVRNALSTASPVLSLPKLGNKGLTALQSALQEKLWSGGGMIFTALFVAGMFYRYRQDRVNTLRLLLLGILATLTLAHAFLTSGESERHPLVYCAPALIVFGVGFAGVMIASSDRWADHAAWALGLLLTVHALPLLREVLEPRRLHFSYPPYYPSLFLGMSDEMIRRGGENPGWMADVPAGAAWYSGQRVWSQPNSLRDFYSIGAEQPMLALVLTPATLDRPYFSELKRRTEASRLGEWADVYVGLAQDRLPSGFPLSQPQRVSDNLIVLIDPLAQPLERP